MPYVDLAFRLIGGKVPVDHGYALYSAISRLLPGIHGVKNIEIPSDRGTRANKWLWFSFLKAAIFMVEVFRLVLWLGERGA